MTFVDDVAYAPNYCTEIGYQGFTGDDFADNFKLKNVDCTVTRFVFCTEMWAPPGGVTHNGFPVEVKLMDSTNVDIMKAAFAVMKGEDVEVEDTNNENSGGNTGGDDVAEEEQVDEAGSSTKKNIIIAIVVIVFALVLFIVLGKK